VQVDPIKPTLKPPGTKRLKLNYDELLSKFKLCRYNQEVDQFCELGEAVQVDPMKPKLKPPGTKRLNYDIMNRLQTLLSNSTCTATGGHPVSAVRDGPGALRRASQGRAVQVDPMRPTLKAPGTKRLKLK
jgi:hypothetical protein